MVSKIDKAAVDPSTMPEGTKVDYRGEFWMRWPEMLCPEVSCAGAVRWASADGEFRTDEAMVELFADGAEVIGLDSEAVDDYHRYVGDYDRLAGGWE